MAIQIQKNTLSNGLKVIVHEDHTTPLASFNVAYNVGSRDENPDHTGLAHLMEHFMFCGSKNVPRYDTMLQKVGATNNAYTSQDMTHYYILLPANNLETAFWLESDRMLELAFEQQSLDVQKHVVIEEFKESYLNRPYGDLMMLFNGLVYERHPYQWLPIGKETKHIANVDMDLIKDFHHRFYSPDNAVLVVAGDVHFDEVMTLAEKWFGDIPASGFTKPAYPHELPQEKARKLVVKRPVPSDMLMKGWLMCDRMHPDYYGFDLLSDLLGTGQSSWLYKKFVVDKPLFTDLDACVSGTADEGVLMIMGRPAEGVSLEDADKYLTDYLYNIPFDDTLKHDLQKVQNRAEGVLLNNSIKIDDRGANIAVWETFGTSEYFLNETQHYFDVTEAQIKRLAHENICQKRENTLYYCADK